MNTLIEKVVDMPNGMKYLPFARAISQKEEDWGAFKKGVNSVYPLFDHNVRKLDAFTAPALVCDVACLNQVPSRVAEAFVRLHLSLAKRGKELILGNPSEAFKRNFVSFCLETPLVCMDLSGVRLSPHVRK